jgi:integrase
LKLATSHPVTAPVNPAGPTTLDPWQAVALVGQALLALAQAAGVRTAAGLAPVAGFAGSPQLLLPASTLTVLELVNEFLLAKARQQKSDRYLRQMRVSLKSFTQGRANRPIHSLLLQDVEAWLKLQDWAPRTCKGYLGDVRTMFNWAVRRGYIPKNPANAVELPASRPEEPPEIFTPVEVKQILEAVRKVDLDVMRVLCLRFFAGVRNAEAHRLREEDIKLEQDLLEVPAAKSKTRARRLVTLQPNLKAWLELGGELGPIGDVRIREALRRSRSGVPWKPNAARHSFVSYHLARFQNAGRTALEAGHTEQMTFANYRALVTPAAALEFWAIVPD